jgi:hypothetical protein
MQLSLSLRTVIHAYHRSCRTRVLVRSRKAVGLQTRDGVLKSMRFVFKQRMQCQAP